MLGYQIPAFCIIFFILIEVAPTTNALPVRPMKSTMKAFQILRIASYKINSDVSAGKLSGYKMKFSSSPTSHPATPIGGGAYQEVSQKELLEGVEDKPVLLRRPEKLNNKYYGLRHGVNFAVSSISFTYISSIDGPYL